MYSTTHDLNPSNPNSFAIRTIWLLMHPFSIIYLRKTYRSVGGSRSLGRSSQRQASPAAAGLLSQLLALIWYSTSGDVRQNYNGSKPAVNANHNELQSKTSVLVLGTSIDLKGCNTNSHNVQIEAHIIDWVSLSIHLFDLPIFTIMNEDFMQGLNEAKWVTGYLYCTTLRLYSPWMMERSSELEMLTPS
ncbi:hypothetical protein CAPTEDRAFT_191617 [Capitella teleta]|uniref:Uncharacterized protein n=1 Tax=Capitella teleta TaxID=283909 RepID=R7V0P8_CAPTE|nr:hypothetical protein CAPTEDRAFT_191617 [Capitella teleta]|eukprot:ELU09787.1 hypothetical protein CAPTEDRAFT_191617 [Capitella teleta]